MASRLNPYLSFRNNAREAMEFYQQVFGGELTVSTFGEFGMPDAEAADLIMHAQLETPRGFTPMASRLNPYISFDGSAREAMEFYADVFGGELNASTFGELGGMEGADGNKIMHAQLETPSGFTLMASDTPPGMEYTPGNNMAVSRPAARC